MYGHVVYYIPSNTIVCRPNYNFFKNDDILDLPIGEVVCNAAVACVPIAASIPAAADVLLMLQR